MTRRRFLFNWKKMKTVCRKRNLNLAGNTSLSLTSTRKCRPLAMMRTNCSFAHDSNSRGRSLKLTIPMALSTLFRFSRSRISHAMKAKQRRVTARSVVLAPMLGVSITTSDSIRNQDISRRLNYVMVRTITMTKQKKLSSVVAKHCVLQVVSCSAKMRHLLLLVPSMLSLEILITFGEHHLEKMENSVWICWYLL